MELNNKVKELEDELKVLKAEIRNVLVDIREVILEKNNPFAEEQESAFIRMDLNTTARAMAAEAAAHEVGKAAAQADEQPKDEEPKGEESTEKKPEDEAGDLSPKDKTSRKKGKESKDSPKTEAVAPVEPAEVPPMYRASPDALGLAAWVVNAMNAVGPHELDRVIAIQRLCGNLPPNVSEALAHLQELIRSSSGEEPHWLAVLQELDRLASS